MREAPRTASLILSGLLLLPAGAAAAPVSSSELVPGLEHPVRVLRDHDGVAHLSAANRHDLYLMQGWIHAEDRFFQMDVLRRTPSGTLAELLGDAALASDVQLRTIGLRRAAERSWTALTPTTQADLEAYAAGVNAWLGSHPVPLEHSLLELTQAAPWTPVDSIVIAKLIAFGLSFDLDIDLTEAALIYLATGEALGFDGSALLFEDMFRTAPFDPAITIPGFLAASAPKAATRPSLATSPHYAESEKRDRLLSLIRSYRAQAERVPLLAAAMAPRERVQGSNEWAVAGTHTGSGRPIIANDPHLALDTPATFYPMHLRAAPDSLNTTGMTFPGAPYVILGQNQFITWGATTNPLDVTDTYLEEVVLDAASPSGLSTVYLGNPEPIVPIPLVFRYNVLDGTPDNLAVAPPDDVTAGTFVPAVALIVPRRNQGPILAIDLAAGSALSVQYTGFSATRELDAFRTWNAARGLHAFERGLETFDVGSQNWVVADLDGNIAYFTSGEMPLREDLQSLFVAGVPPWLVRDGTGGNEWIPAAAPDPRRAILYEILPADEMPHTVNPSSGFFVNANNDPVGTSLDNNPLNQLRPGGGLYYLSPGYDGGFRAGRITQALQERLAAGKVTATDMKEIQSNVRLLDAEVLTPHILDAFENASEPGADPVLAALAADAGVAEAVARLAAWDGSFPTGIEEGFDASDEGGVRLPPTQDEMDASVAATIYSVWRGQILHFAIDVVLDARDLPRPGSNEVMKAFRHLLDTFATTHGVGASGLEFFPFGGVDDPEDRRDGLILACLLDSLALLASDDLAPAFHNSTDQDDYRWGYLHRLVLDHLIGSPFSIPPAGGAFPPPLPGLSGIPVDGGFGAVDASSHSVRADSLNEFMFGSGPVRRYVGEPGTTRSSIVGESSLPGGTSGVLGSPHYADLLPRWLTNETYPVLFDPRDVVDNAAQRIVYRPAD